MAKKGNIFYQKLYVFKELTHTLILSISRDVCVYNIPSVNDRNRESWRLVVKERIANIAKQITPFFWEGFNDFLCFSTNLGFKVFGTTLL